MKAFNVIAFAGLFALLASACATEDETITRTAVSGKVIEYSEPSAAGLPLIELEPDDGFALASCPRSDKNCLKDQNQKLIATLKLAGEKIKQGVYSGNNLYAAGVAWGNANAESVTSCVKVQIQERKAGKIIVKETLVPEGQPEECRASDLKGLSAATMAIFVKVFGNNYAAGIGVGAVAYKHPYIVGCAAGAVGYASETYQSSYGVTGAFCTQIYDVETGAVY